MQTTLRSLPWEHLETVASEVRRIATEPATRDMVESLDHVVQDVKKLPLDHVLNVVDRFVPK